MGEAEYLSSIDTWLNHQLLSSTSEAAVVALDTMWQNVLAVVASLDILLDQHDASSLVKMRPDFTAMFHKMLVMKGEAKANHIDMVAFNDDLTCKFHKTAYKLFPDCCSLIPAVTTCNQSIHLFSIQYFNDVFSKQLVKEYDVRDLDGRVEFIVDTFKILRWILSQTQPREGFHIPPGVRTKTRNGHHITLSQSGILKEFDVNKLNSIDLRIIEIIYRHKLQNIEHGTVNHTSLTITRVGSQLKDAIKVRHLTKEDIYNQVQSGVEQLHSIGYAHCDICMDNIFVDSIEDSGRIFIGDLEYCRLKDDPSPVNIRRSDSSANTAEDLDNIQLKKLKDELAIYR